MSRVSEAESLVFEFEELTEYQLRQLLGRKNGSKLADEYVTAKCLTDFWWFLKVGVAYPMKHYSPSLHGHGPHPLTGAGLASFMMDWRIEKHGEMIPCQNKFVIMAREHCKTQEASIAWPVWRLARDPNERILLRSHVDPKSQEILRGMRDIIDNCGPFRQRFPWVTPAMDRNRRLEWSNSRLTVKRDDIGIRTSTVEAYGIEADPTGGHYTIKIYDDFETLDATYSEILREKMLDVFRLDDNLGTGGAVTLVVGTPYHPRALIAKAIKGQLDGLDYGLFYAPDTYQVFDSPFSGQEPILLDNRQTLRVSGFPFPENELELCQAKVSFFSPVASDVVTEIREVEWNDANHFRVSRPFPAVLGQPISWQIGNRKPTCPERFTLDSIDILPEPELRETMLARQSLDRKRIVQGPFINSCQMRLDPIDPANTLFDAKLVKLVSANELPDGERRYYRSCDLATPKETGCYSGLVTGFHHLNGFYITHIAWGNLKPKEILLELFMGHLRCADAGNELIWTSFEEAAIEATLGDFLPAAQKDPYSFFSALGGKYQLAADRYFKERGRIWFPRKSITRGSREAKVRRIASVEPMLAAGQIYMVENIEHSDRMLEEMASFSLEGDNMGIDLLDCLADLIREGKPPRIVKEREEKPMNQFRVREMNAIRRNAARGRAINWSP